MSVCVYCKNSLTAKLLCFSFTVKLLIGPGKVYKRYPHPPKRTCTWNKSAPPKNIIILKIKIKEEVRYNPPPLLKVSLDASRGIAASIY